VNCHGAVTRAGPSGRMDVVAVLIAVATFAILLLLVDGLDRV
jgi:hypothetical protein